MFVFVVSNALRVLVPIVGQVLVRLIIVPRAASFHKRSLTLIPTFCLGYSPSPAAAAGALFRDTNSSYNSVLMQIPRKTYKQCSMLADLLYLHTLENVLHLVYIFLFS